jgi:hypothetical protein
MAQEELYGAMAQETGTASRQSLAAALKAPAGLPTRAATAETTTALAGGRAATVAETLVVERTAIAAPSKYIPYEPVTAVARREVTAVVAPSRMLVRDSTVVRSFPRQGGGYFDRARAVASEDTVVFQRLQQDMANPGMACVPSSCRMVLRKRGIDISVRDLGDAMGTNAQGTYLHRAADALDGLTMNGQTIAARFEGASSPAALIKALQQGDDAIVGIARQFPGQTRPSHHAVIVERFDTARDIVRIRDPGTDVYEVTVREFLERWTRTGMFIR